MQIWSLGQEDPLEEKMATHSSTLAWKIPWTEEACGLQSIGSQRVRHNSNWACNLLLHWGSEFLPFSSVLTIQFSSVQSLTHVRLFVTPWTAARQASLSITSSQSLLKLMSIELVMPSNHLILCGPLFLLPSILSSIRVFSNELVLHINRLQIFICKNHI